VSVPKGFFLGFVPHFSTTHCVMLTRMNSLKIEKPGIHVSMAVLQED
jgi:hypothetical protein